MSGAVALVELARDEVVELHAFFVAWFTGAGGDFSCCAGALSEDFRMVTPEGEVHRRAAVLERIRAAKGALGADFRIAVLDPQPVWAGETAVLLEYVEEQYRDGRETCRRSTALFTRKPTAPRGVEWRHLQETWIVP